MAVDQKTLKRGAAAAFIAGLALFTGLITYYGVIKVAEALAVAGWGLFVVAAYHLVPMITDTVSWRYLVLPRGRLGFIALLYARWIGESINNLLPVAQVGGDVMKARMITRYGIPGAQAGASIVVDITVAVFTQILYTLIGLGLLVTYLDTGATAWVIFMGVLASVILLGGFVIGQRYGLFVRAVLLLQRISGRKKFFGLMGGAKALDAAVAHLYGARHAMIYAVIWRFAAWVLGAGEVWLAMYFLGHPVTIAEALLLESLGEAAAAAAFAIPGSLGVQEGGFIVFGGILGFGADVSLALSLTKRVRELMWGIPGLLAWQGTEARSFFS